MRIAYSYQGKELVFNHETTQVVIGRPQEGVAFDLDFTPDQTVSRPHAQHHEHAVRAAVGMQAAMREVNAERTARGLVTCGIGIGVHCGQVVHGFIGALERMEFTVIGDAVNRAARYCDGAPEGEVLLSPEVYARVFSVVQAAPTTIPTKHEGNLQAYRIRGLKPEL